MTLKIIFTLTQFIYLIRSQNVPSTLVRSPSDLSNSSLAANNTLKLLLRYGFHQTAECEKFDKVYLCIQKCIDLNYDVAKSDKNCICTCYIRPDKAKYKNKGSTNTKWKLGVPTTVIPAWARKNMTQKLDITKTATSEKDHDIDHTKDKHTTASLPIKSTVHETSIVTNFTHANEKTEVTDLSTVTLDSANSTDTDVPLKKIVTKYIQNNTVTDDISHVTGDINGTVTEISSNSNNPTESSKLTTALDSVTKDSKVDINDTTTMNSL